MPKVSVVVPNYNHARYLPARLDSVFAQTYADYEVILLDDHSTDGSAALLGRYATHEKVREVVLGENNSGPFAQWRRGISQARGEYIWIAESDDLAHDSFLQHMVLALDARPTVGLAYCQSQIIDEHGRPLFDNRRWTNDLDKELWSAHFQMPGARCIHDYFMFKNVIPNASAVLFRTSLFQKLVSADIEQFRYAGDWLAWCQILRTCDLYFTPLQLNSFRQHPRSTREGRAFPQSARYLSEVYRVIAQIARDSEVDAARLSEAHERLAVKTYQELGVRNLLAPRSLRLIGQLASYDPRLWRRLLKLAARSAKQKVSGS